MGTRRTRSARHDDDSAATPGRRPLWNGVIGFGLVSIPVSLHSAARPRGLDLDYLDRRDFAPVGYQRINKVTGQAVAWADIVRGYRMPGTDQYVVLGEEDFRIANPLATQTIAIEAFVDANEVSPAHFDTPYWLKPGRRGEKAYVLLRETLARTRRMAIARVVIRTKSSLCGVVADGSALLLNTLRFGDALRPAERLGPRGSGKATMPSAREIAMAERFVEELSAAWQPGDYRDDYRNDLLRRIKAKARAGKAHEVPQPGAEDAATPKSAEVVDLMELLKRSLDPGVRASKSKPRGSKAPVRRRAA